MSTVNHHKVVSQLPVLLDSNAIYYVRVGAGVDIYVTNDSGMVVAYPLNAGAGTGGTSPAITMVPVISGTLNLAYVVDSALVILNQNVTGMILPNGVAGYRVDLKIRFEQDINGNRSVNFGGLVGGTTPALNSAPSSVTWISLANADNNGWSVVSSSATPATTIGGQPVNITTAQTGDLLTYTPAGWINQNRTSVADGGNF